MMIGKNSVVAINYTLTNDAGEVMDSSEGRDPLTYLHGAHNLIPGLEKQLEGKTAGASFKATIAPADGYGESDPAMIQTLPREMFRGVDNIEVGMGFTAQGPQGQQNIMVTAINGDEVTVDGNHPMAGKTLHFAVEVISVREATAEEIDHGHVHDGSHHH
ncbi:MAG: peptidylprolyl isomerase [Pseudohongiella sp.]|nr:peptidylprolyl isomerase [Pseudohongiella sp.]MDO9520390.1 peptidylprolyl isomerase [Pseudohongiella sp.]MDP2126601.1 peptidylprolyl isomerase [Pseudohongiella sp.]